MATFTKEELNKILENHMHWILEDCDDWRSMRADLSDADLRGVDLSFANLCGAKLYGVDLSRANLRGANLSCTSLYDANLRKADLSDANLSGANLCDANLYEAILCGTIPQAADLYGADLERVNLCDTNLYGADLHEAKNVPFIPMVCPDTGLFTAWKKAAVLKGRNSLDVIVKLEVPEDARRSSATSRKCRCDKAIVKSITSLDGSESFNSAFSKYDKCFIYEVGKTVSVPDFDENRFNECTSGIHFFVNRQEAVDY